MTMTHPLLNEICTLMKKAVLRPKMGDYMPLSSSNTELQAAAASVRPWTTNIMSNRFYRKWITQQQYTKALLSKKQRPSVVGPTITPTAPVALSMAAMATALAVAATSTLATAAAPTFHVPPPAPTLHVPPTVPTAPTLHVPPPTPTATTLHTTPTLHVPPPAPPIPLAPSTPSAPPRYTPTYSPYNATCCKERDLAARIKRLSGKQKAENICTLAMDIKLHMDGQPWGSQAHFCRRYDIREPRVSKFITIANKYNQLAKKMDLQELSSLTALHDLAKGKKERKEEGRGRTSNPSFKVVLSFGGKEVKNDC
ncbi:hypothetical protein JOM56_011573 [Amanita muscaria]